tara:strand:+ start:63 stop:272 length:210 start_codon:yes stop_codon:yes gene_type:complete
MIEFIEEKYEGIVTRQMNSYYTYSRNGKRSNDAFKLKIRPTLDVNVINYVEGTGKDTGCVIWVCNYNGK